MKDEAPKFELGEHYGPIKAKWYYRPWFVLLMLIFVLGPFGLPLVYKSPCFNRTWKIILTVMMVLYVYVLILVTMEAVDYIVRMAGSIRESYSMVLGR